MKSLKMNKSKELFSNFIKLPLKYIVISILILAFSNLIGISTNLIVAIMLFAYLCYFYELVFSKQTDKLSYNNLVYTILEFAIFAMISAPIAVYSITIIASSLPDHFPRTGSADTWIVFAGSIIGGSMTMFALAFSISYSANQMKIQRKVSINPILKVDFQRRSANYISLQNGENSTSFQFKISCHSIYPAKNIRVSSFLVEYLDEEGTLLHKKKKRDSSVHSLLSNNENHLITFQLFETTMHETIVANTNKINVCVVVSYTNIDDAIDYMHRSEFVLMKKRSNYYLIKLLSSDVNEIDSTGQILGNIGL